MNVRELIQKLEELDADDMEVRYYVDGFPEADIESVKIWAFENEDAFVLLA